MHFGKTGAPEGTRTPGLLLRRQLLYPAELLAQVGAGDGNRTHVASLEGWNSTIELHPQLFPRRPILYQIKGVIVNPFLQKVLNFAEIQEKAVNTAAHSPCKRSGDGQKSAKFYKIDSSFFLFICYNQNNYHDVL
jgi:hypothetical protein